MKKGIRVFIISGVFGSLPACASVWGTAKGAICGAKESIKPGVTALTSPFGAPGALVGGVVNGGLDLLCGAASVVAEGGAAVTGATVDKVATVTGLVPKSP